MTEHKDQYKNKISRAAIHTIEKSGEVVGSVISSAGNSELYQLLADKFGINWLFNRIISVDLEKTRRQVTKFKEKYPDATPAQIADKLTTHKAYYMGTIGFASGLIPGNIPAIIFDFVTTVGAQAELVYEIALAYGMDLNDDSRKGEVLTLIALGAGSTKSAEVALKLAMDISAKKMGPAMANVLIKSLAMVIGEKLAKKFITKLIPLVGAFIGAGLNISMLKITGAAANNFYKNITSKDYIYSGDIPEDLKKIFPKSDVIVDNIDSKQEEIFLKVIIYLLKKGKAPEETIHNIINQYFPDVSQITTTYEMVLNEINQSSYSNDFIENLDKETVSLIITKSIMCLNALGPLNDFHKLYLKALATKYDLPFE